MRHTKRDMDGMMSSDTLMYDEMRHLSNRFRSDETHCFLFGLTW